MLFLELMDQCLPNGHLNLNNIFENNVDDFYLEDVAYTQACQQEYSKHNTNDKQAIYRNSRNHPIPNRRL